MTLTHRLVPMLILLLASPLSGCLMTQDWPGELPKTGVNLSNDQRMSEFHRFSEIHLLPNNKALKGSAFTGELYSGESFAPVVDSLDPSLYLQLRSAEKYNYARQFTAVITVLAGTSAATSPKRRAKNISLAIAVVSALLDYWFNSKVEDLMDSANKSYQDRLDERIFPQSPNHAESPAPAYGVVAWQIKCW